MTSLINRTKAIAAKARATEDGQSRVPVKEFHGTFEAGKPSPQTPREWWTVYRWEQNHVLVYVSPPQTQHQMRELYPTAVGIIAA